MTTKINLRDIIKRAILRKMVLKKGDLNKKEISFLLGHFKIHPDANRIIQSGRRPLDVFEYGFARRCKKCNAFRNYCCC